MRTINWSEQFSQKGKLVLRKNKYLERLTASIKIRTALKYPQKTRTGLLEIAFKIILCLILLTLSIGAVLAQSSLGIGVAEQSINPASPFAGFFLKIQAWQMQFEREIQTILIAMRNNSEGTSWLIGLSFLYGILHAAGPGHGKAVISSYLIADHASLKRGIILSFFSSILQALSAILIVAAIFWFLPGQLTQTTRFVILVSYVLVMVVGLWLIIRRVRNLLTRRKGSVNALFDNLAPPSLPVAPPRAVNYLNQNENRSTTFMMATPSGGSASIMSTALSPSKAHSQPHLAWRKAQGGKMIRNFRQICAECGQAHLIDADHVRQKLPLKTALSLIFATGLRPCNGALFVISFALLNQLETVGIIAVLAMALGTFITVSLLASLAVYAKNLALRFATRKKTYFGGVKIIIELCAALFIFITGFLLVISSLI